MKLGSYQVLYAKLSHGACCALHLSTHLPKYSETEGPSATHVNNKDTAIILQTATPSVWIPFLKEQLPFRSCRNELDLEP